MNTRTKIIVTAVTAIFFSVGAIYAYSVNKVKDEDGSASVSGFLMKVNDTSDGISPERLKSNIRAGLDMNSIIVGALKRDLIDQDDENHSVTVLQYLVITAPTLARAAIEVGPIDGLNNDGDTALMHACNVKSLPLVKQLLEKGADITHKNVHGFTALHALFVNSADDQEGAVAEREILKLLLQKGANPDSRSNIGTSVLSMALANGSSETVKVLIKHLKQIDLTPDDDGDTLLHFAASGSSGDSIRIVLNDIPGGKGLINKANKENKTPVMLAVANDGLKDLLNAGADLTAQDKDGNRLLNNLAMANDLEGAVVALRKGGNPNYSNKTGQTPLHNAVSACNGKLAATLVKAGAKLDVADVTGVTPVELARMAQEDCTDNIEQQYLKRLVARKK